jgi:ribosomal-protein-alanine N-acetyltransferase
VSEATFAPLPEPRLEDGAIRIRLWEEGDLAAVEAAVADPEIVRHNRLPSPFDARAWFAAMPAQRRRGEALRLLIVDAGDDSLLGATALFHFDRRRSAAEVGYWLAAEARGRGIGGRAVALLCGWAFAELGLQWVEAGTDADNLPSRRLLERAGFVIVGRPDGDEVRYRLDRTSRTSTRLS